MFNAAGKWKRKTNTCHIERKMITLIKIWKYFILYNLYNLQTNHLPMENPNILIDTNVKWVSNNI